MKTLKILYYIILNIARDAYFRKKYDRTVLLGYLASEVDRKNDFRKLSDRGFLNATYTKKKK